jgi:hypothetical protein
MKKSLYFSLIIALIVVSCAQEEKSPIEGAWQMIYGEWTGLDKSFPAQIEGSQIKMWSTGYVSFVGNFKLDTTNSDNYGLGKFKQEGNRYEENFMYFTDTSYIGKTIRLLIEIRNDTLVQKWPVDENWKLVEKFSTEKYVRLK